MNYGLNNAQMKLELKIRILYTKSWKAYRSRNTILYWIYKKHNEHTAKVAIGKSLNDIKIFTETLGL